MIGHDERERKRERVAGWERGRECRRFGYSVFVVHLTRFRDR